MKKSVTCSLFAFLLIMTIHPVSHAIGSMNLRNSTSNISKTLSRQVRKALIPRLVVNPEEKLPILHITASDTKNHVATVHENRIRVWNLKKGILLKEVEYSFNPSDVISLSSNARYLAIAEHASHSVKVHHLLEEATPAKNFAFTADIKALRFSDDASALIIASSNQELVHVSIEKGTRITRQLTQDSDVCCLTVDRNSNHIALASGESVYFLDAAGQDKKTTRLDLQHAITRIFTSPNGDTIIALSDDDNIFSLIRKQKVIRKIIIDKNDQFVGVSANELLFYQNNQLIYRSISDNNKSVFFSDIDLPAISHGISLSDDLSLLVGDDGILYGFRKDYAMPFFTWISTKKGWSIVDYNGRFEGSSGGIQAVSWTADANRVGLSGFSRNYFEPGLFKRLFSSNPKFFLDTIEAIIKGIFFPPDAHIRVDKQGDHANVSITAKAGTAADLDDIQHSFLYHNGKRVNQALLQDSQRDPSERKMEWTYRVPLLNGDNHFHAAVSAWNDIKSISQTISIHSSAEDTGQPALVINSVGIDKYKDEFLNLNYSVADATAVADVFYDKTGKSRNKRIKTLVLDGKAKARNIRAKLQQLASLKNTDTVVIFLSGHGIAINGKWYFLPQEAEVNWGDYYIEKTAISGKEIASAILNTPAQKVLLAIDACQSGAVLNDFELFIQNRTLQQISEDTGIHILTATRADQLAPEFDELGHGLFTFTLLKALEENQQYFNADRWPRDRRLMVSEIKQYVLTHAPVLAEKLYSGNSGIATRAGTGGLDVVVTPVEISSGTDFLVR